LKTIIETRTLPQPATAATDKSMPAVIIVSMTPREIRRYGVCWINMLKIFRKVKKTGEIIDEAITSKTRNSGALYFISIVLHIAQIFDDAGSELTELFIAH
jgi:hypothetical protein